MKRKRHSPEQIIRKLREADAMLSQGQSLAQVCQALEVSEQTFHRWRKEPPIAVKSDWGPQPVRRDEGR